MCLREAGFKFEEARFCARSRRKAAGVKEAIARAGATLRYPPGDSPGFTPIEPAVAKLTAALRKAAARTFATRIEAIAQALAGFTPRECANYIANSGYRPANDENAHAGQHDKKNQRLTRKSPVPDWDQEKMGLVSFRDISAAGEGRSPKPYVRIGRPSAS